MSCHPARLGPRHLRLASSGLTLGLFELDTEPRLWQLMSEDTAWSIAVADWRARRPSRLHWLRRIRWAREGGRHRMTGVRLAAVAHGLGLRVPS